MEVNCPLNFMVKKKNSRNFAAENETNGMRMQ